MKIRSWLSVVGMAAFVVACGDDEPASQPATVNQQAATASARSTISALKATQDASGGASVGPSSASSLSGVAQSSQSLLQAQPGTAGGPRSISSALGLEGEIAPLNLDGPGCTCTATSCTFANCSAGGSSSFTIDGSYSWGGGHVECKNLKYTFGAAGAAAAVGFSTNVVVTLNCDLTITSSSIKGFLQSAGSSSTEIAGTSAAGAYSTSWDVKTTYNDVTFDASGTPTGGSLRVEGTTSTNIGGQTTPFSGSAEVKFP